MNLANGLITTAIVGLIAGVTYMDYKQKLQLAEMKDTLISKIEALKIENSKLRTDKYSAMDLLGKIFDKPITDFTTKTLVVTLTAYSATEAECNSEPYITANHTPSRMGLVAISYDLEHEYGLSLGDYVILPPYGVFLIADRMSTHKHKGTKHVTPITRTIDILHASPEAARRFGVKPDQPAILFLN